MYKPVAQRTTAVKTGYVPVSQRVSVAEPKPTPSTFDLGLGFNTGVSGSTKSNLIPEADKQKKELESYKNRQQLVFKVGEGLSDEQKKKIRSVVDYGGGDGLALTGNKITDAIVLKNKITFNEVQKEAPKTGVGTILATADLLTGSPVKGAAIFAGPGASTFSRAVNKFSSLFDKKPRFEIDDSKAVMRLTDSLDLNKNYHGSNKDLINKVENNTLTVGDLMEHDELYKNYPEIKAVKVDIVDKPYDTLGQGEMGAYNPKTNKIELNLNLKYEEKYKAILLHEIQHWVQEKEAFAKGGSIFAKTPEDTIAVQNVKDRLMRLENEASDEARKILLYGKGEEYNLSSKMKEWNKGINPESKYYLNEQQVLKFELLEKNKLYNEIGSEYNKLFKASNLTPYERYRRLAGEIEARDVQSRQYLSVAERQKTQPYKSQNVPLDEMIVKYSDNSAASFNVKKIALEDRLNTLQNKWANTIDTNARKNLDKIMREAKDELNKLKRAEQQMSISKADNLTSQIQKAKAEGKSFEEWEKRVLTGDDVDINKIGTKRGEPVFIKSYHGTDKDFDKFIIPEKGVRYSGDGVYFSPRKTRAESFGKNVKEAYLDLKNPYIKHIPEGQSDMQFNELAREIKEKGYDSIIVRFTDTDTDTGKLMADWINEIVVFDTNAIKTKSQLKQLWDEADSEKMMSYDPATIAERSTKPQLSESLYQRNREIKRGVFETVKRDLKDIKTGITQGFDKFFGSISTRLKNINPELKANLRKYEFTVRQTVTKDINEVMPFLEKTKKMEKNDWLDFDLARKNGDTVKIDELIKKYDMKSEYDRLRDTLDNLYEQADEVGFDIGYRDAYHPRVIKDVKGFLNYMRGTDNWAVIDDAIKAKETALGRYLDETEKATLINTMIRGYQQNNITLSEIGAMKTRVIDLVDAELNQFYMTSDGALTQYISKANEAISARKFFGKGDGNVEDSIGAYILKQISEGKIKPEDEAVLSEILKARFNEQGTRGVVGLYKNLSYIDTMGSPTSAITQIGDLAFSIYKGGIKNTAKGIWKSVFGKSQITKADLGIKDIASEFSDPTKASKAVDRVFKLIGLEKMDAIGKETLVESVLLKYQKWAGAGDERLVPKLKAVFGDDYNTVLGDLKAGNITEDVKLLMFNELADVQPILLSEMPEKYLTGGNGRIFYMLKTYTLKLFDVYRNDIFQEIAKGNRVTGIKNAVYLAGALAAMNATADEIKDLILGRETSLKDKTVDNVLRLAGFSKYLTWKARTEGIGSAMARQILPPFKFIDSVYKDIVNDTSKGLEIPQSIPLGGKLYYWWFGKGAAKKEKSKPTSAGLPKLPKMTLPRLPSIGK